MLEDCQQTSGAHGHIWSTSRRKCHARHPHHFQVELGTRTCTPASGTARSRSNRIHGRRKININAASQQNKHHHLNTFSTVRQVGVSPTRTCSAESQFWEPKCAHAIAGNGGRRRMWVFLLAVASGRRSLPKRVRKNPDVENLPRKFLRVFFEKYNV